MVWLTLACTSDLTSPPALDSGMDSAPSTEMAWQQAPVIVIGGGPSGLATAMDLDEAVLFEASSQLGGRAPGAGQLMYFVGTEEQLAHGVHDSVEQALEDWPAYTGSQPTAQTEAFLRSSVELRDRLVGMGLAFMLSGPDFPLRRQRNHGVLEPGLSAGLIGGLHPGIEVHLDTPVTGLVIDGGRVLGVETREGQLRASHVVIASGGFAGRLDLLDGRMRWEEGSWRPGGDGGAQGDALDWALEYGFAVQDLDHMGALPEALGVPDSQGLALDIYRPGPAEWIFVDSAGRMAVDESQTYSLVLAAKLEQGAPTWQLITLETVLERLPEGEEAALAALRCGEDWASLAGEVGVDPAGLSATFDMLSTPQRDNLQGTPCIVPPGFVATKGFGGLAVDERQRVLDADGQPIEGLYAVGEAAGMAVPGLGGTHGFDGSLSAVVWSGWRAAAAIQEE